MISSRGLTRAATLAAALLMPLSAAAAQCPDGSPPPCRGASVASAARRANPPLDDNTWIVVPFDNLAKSGDAEWLRTGSVNLLYLGMSRWSDLRVIDDERVADFMREVPDARDASVLSLNAGLAVAKRAGAGRLVMGDVLKLGARTAVTAKVFDVRTGQRLRSVREETAIQDSVIPMFGKLAQRVLNVAPLPGASAGIVGTNSISAYQEYVQGMQALNHFDMQRAHQHLTRALELDSTFALAHAKLGVLGGWISPTSPANRVHAEAAARLSSSLPPREKALIAANVEFARRNYLRACEGFRALIRSDSTDTDAWYGLGDCLFHDPALEIVEGDTSRVRWRANLNESMRAFRRVLELDPTYHLAYSHIVDAAQNHLRGGQLCPEGGRCRSYVAVLRPSGDSLLLIPLSMPRDTLLFREHQRDYLATGARRRILEGALTVASQWVQANPSEDRARLAHGTTLLNLGRVVEADSTLRGARLSDTSNSAGSALTRLEIAVKLWRAPYALRLYDSIRTHGQTIAVTPAGTITTGGLAAQVAPIFGRLSDYDSLMRSSFRQAGVGPAQERVARQVVRAMMGMPADSLAFYERALFDEIAAVRGQATATATLAFPLSFGLRAARSSWPAIDTATRDPRIRPAVALMRQDTLALRVATRRLDSLSSVLVAALLPDTGASLVAAEGYLALRDSLNALRMTRRWLDSSVAAVPLLLGGGPAQSQPLLPRAMLVRADLAAALGFKDEARVWYQRFLDFWAKSDAEFASVVERARKARAGLAPP